MKQTPKRVLVVDDDYSIRHLIAALVRRENIAVDMAADGEEAIERLREHDYAVILLDLMMPRVDGFGVVKYLSEHPSPQKPIIFVITAFGDQAFKKVDSGIVAGVIHKPFEVSEIGSLVRQCVMANDNDLRHALRRSRERAIREFDAFVKWTDRSEPEGRGTN